MTCLFAFNVYAGSTTYKHDQTAQTSTKTMKLNAEWEMETDQNLNDLFYYTHLQLLGEMNCKLANVALGARYIDKESKDPYWAPMIDIKRDFKIRSKLTLKNRVRYIYEIIEKADDPQTFRYRLNLTYSLTPKTKIDPSAEVFCGNDLEYKRMRYGVKIDYSISKKTSIALGYEFNDNHEKDNSDTIVTQIGYKF